MDAKGNAVPAGGEAGQGLGLLVLALGLALGICAGTTQPAPAPAAPEPEEEEEELPLSEDCAICHDSEALVKKLPDGTTRSLFVAENALEGSVHESLECLSCHVDIRELPHPDGKPILRARCDSCHTLAVKSHEAGRHGLGSIEGDGQKIQCTACHGSAHRLLASDNPKSPTYRTRIPQTCAACHGGVKMVVDEFDRSLTQPFFSYQSSVHGKAVEAGSTDAAVCTDCHSSHDIRPASDPTSPSFRFRIPETCGRCHESVAEEYRESVHGTAVRRGSGRSPVCTDCHGIHAIKDPLDPTSSVAAQAIARTTCPQCHQGVALADEFGLAAGHVESYLASYHGLALRRGSTTVANCASCHGVHDILPSTDPRSTIHPERLPDTCGECHPGAGENFVRGRIHHFSDDLESPGPTIVSVVETLYVALIVIVISGMLLHNLLDLRRKADPRHRCLPASRALPASSGSAPRLDLHQRIQHAVLVSCFALLVFTGFALRFPESWLSGLLGEGESTRRFIHRAAGVALLLLGLHHAIYVLVTKAGRRALGELRPGLSDLRDAGQMLKYNLGLIDERPPERHFAYPEKLEYWAVVWGTALMGVTGFLLWFKMVATEWLGSPLWIVDLARVVHYYEAWLATLSILVWHFHFVIFDPTVYPMSRAWWSGWTHGRPPEPPREES